MSTPTLSVQLYSCRDHLKDLDGTFEALAGIGLTAVEGFAFLNDPAGLAEALARHGLAVPSGHAPFLSDELRFGDQRYPVPPLEVVLDAAEVLGMGRVIDPMVAEDRWTSVEAIRATAERLNAAAAMAAVRGIRLGYHNHHHELIHDFGGRTGLEIFADNLDDGVFLELDVYWAAVAGQDVVALIERLGSHVQALHLKDGHVEGAGAPLIELASRPQLPAGQGDLPLADILDAATSAELAVIEFDTYDGDIFQGIGESFRFLAGLGLR